MPIILFMGKRLSLVEALKKVADGAIFFFSPLFMPINVTVKVLLDFFTRFVVT